MVKLRSKLSKVIIVAKNGPKWSKNSTHHKFEYLQISISGFWFTNCPSVCTIRSQNIVQYRNYCNVLHELGCLTFRNLLEFFQRKTTKDATMSACSIFASYYCLVYFFYFSLFFCCRKSSAHVTSSCCTTTPLQICETREQKTTTTFLLVIHFFGFLCFCTTPYVALNTNVFDI